MKIQKKQPKNTSQWISSIFPENYKTYFELCAETGSILLTKPQSEYEVLNFCPTVNNSDKYLKTLFTAIRDKDSFLKELKMAKFNKKHFDLFLTNQEECTEEFREFYLRRMSKNYEKTKFLDNKTKSLRLSPPIWQLPLSDLKIAQDRLRAVFMFNLPIKSGLALFNAPDSFIFADPTRLATKNSFEWTEEAHTQFFSYIEYYRAKIAVLMHSNPVVNKLYSKWNAHKRKINNKTSNEIIWTNY